MLVRMRVQSLAQQVSSIDQSRGSTVIMSPCTARCKRASVTMVPANNNNYDMNEEWGDCSYRWMMVAMVDPGHDMTAT